MNRLEVLEQRLGHKAKRLPRDEQTALQQLGRDRVRARKRAAREAGHSWPDQAATRAERERRRAIRESLPGYQCHQLIKWWLGQEAIAGCGCGSVIAEMNRLGVEGCRANQDDLAGKLYTKAVERNWTIQPEPGIEVAAADIGKPVPQTWRTAAARLVARVLSGTAVGSAFVREHCVWLIVHSCDLAEEAGRRAAAGGTMVAEG